MPTNDFLPFGSAVGANVMLQADYLALTARLNGFSAGTANSGQLNKVWRQSAIMAAVIGQLIANRSGQNAVDDGTTATLLTNLELAINGLSQIGSGTYAAGGGTANAHTAAFNPPVTALTDGMVLKYKSSAANTGACTFNPNGLGAKSIVGFGHSALQGGEIVVNSDVWVQYNSSLSGGSWVLIDSSGGALSIAPATQSQHAVQLQQMAGVVGGTVNAKMTVTAASANATFTADEVAVKAALGGVPWLLSGFNKAINLATTGAGGMDTGAAPVNGYVALYAAFNPLLPPSTTNPMMIGQNATSTVMPAVYGGANMPAGYTASALLTVVPTNGSSQFKICTVRGRSVSILLVTVLTSTSNVAASNISISSAVPPNAVKILGELGLSSTSASNLSVNIFSDVTSNVGQQNVSGAVAASGNLFGNYSGVHIITPQTIAVSASTSGAGPTFNVYIGGYDI